MNHFQPKSLAFYGVAISSVLILFKTATFWGEKKLQAPALIHNIYQVNLSKNLPNCEQINTLQLNIQQSGIYLNAALVPIHPQRNFNQQLNLNGMINNQNLSLSGKVDDFSLCQSTHPQKNLHHNLTMQMSLVNKDNITGQLNLDNFSPLKFTAVPVTKQAETSKSSNQI
ncbi:MAG TPA: hypothetical protein VK203_00905 [Nostocaceae cyanobacterium]|nr:hypothetical protein [Nostocaceae cyanobacterium]